MATKIKTTAGELVTALGKLSNDRPLAVIFSQNADIDVKCVAPDARVWANPNMKKSLSNLTVDKEYNFLIAGWPRQIGDTVLIPILWKRTIGWVKMGDFMEIEAEAKPLKTVIINSNYNGWLSDAGVWPGSSAVRYQLQTGQSIQVFDETSTHYRIGNDLWIDKNFVDHK